MPAYSKELRQTHLERVRAVRIMHPRASILKIQKTLADQKKYPLVLNHHYIGDLLRRIEAERVSRFDREKVERRIAELEDQKNQTVEILWSVIMKGAAPKDAITAAKAIFEVEHEFLQAQMDAGIFTRHIGQVDVNHAILSDIPEDHQKKLVEAFAMAGINLLKKYGGNNRTTDIITVDAEPAKLGDVGNDGVALDTGGAAVGLEG